MEHTTYLWIFECVCVCVFCQYMLRECVCVASVSICDYYVVLIAFGGHQWNEYFFYVFEYVQQMYQPILISVEFRVAVTLFHWSSVRLAVVKSACLSWRSAFGCCAVRFPQKWKKGSQCFTSCHMLIKHYGKYLPSPCTMNNKYEYKLLAIDCLIMMVGFVFSWAL